MFKTNEKRFQYDIGPPSLDNDQYSYKYSHPRPSSEYPISSTTPINRRVPPNQSTVEVKDHHHISVQDPQSHYDQPQDRYISRGRRNSTSGYKRSIEKGASRNDRGYDNEQFKQTKKVYFGGEDLFTGSNSVNRANIRHNRPDQNTRINGEDLSSFNIADTSHMSSGKLQKPSKKSIEKPLSPTDSSNLNQKEIMAKILRINRLNQQINSRLQRMLTKIDQQ